MKEISVEELLKLQVEILEKVDRYCRANSIPYTVFGGTCIGAVRHKGYIPWDDDIDIAMTRPNYERFIRSFNGKVENLELFAPELNWNYYAPYANVCDTRTILDEGVNGHNGMKIGVKIDVFPIDGVSSDIEEYHNEKKIFAQLWDKMYIKRVILPLMWKKNKRSALLFVIRRLLLLKESYASLQKNARDLVTNQPYEKSEYVDLRCIPWPHDSRVKREVFEEYHDTQFENITVLVIKRYDDYLTQSYGEYMKLPPEEQRKPHHHFKAYWKD